MGKFNRFEMTWKIFSFHRLWLITNLLSNLWEQHIAGVSSEYFCFMLLTSKNQFVHSFLIGVIVIFAQTFRSIPAASCVRLAQLALLGVVFLATNGLYDMGCIFSIFKCSAANHLGKCPWLIINGYNEQFNSIKGRRPLSLFLNL